MRIRRAEWECENLGLNAMEVEFEPGDQSLETEAQRQIEESDYVLVRVPVGQTRLVHELEEAGFRFLATQCFMAVDLVQPVRTPALAKAVDRHVRPRPITTADQLDQVLCRVDGNMFDTDRISMDPALPSELALKRHQDIIRSLFDDDRNISQALYLGDELIGFFQLQYRSDQHFFASLAGVFSPHKGSGLGVAAIWLPLHWAMQTGVRSLTTSNSTNNPDSVRVHLAMGYRIERFDYVLRRTSRKGQVK